MLAGTPTSNFADVQNVSNDVLRNLGRRFSPGYVDGAGGQSTGRQTFWSSREIFGLGYCQPGTGLVGASAVFRNALVDGLVLRSDPGQSQGATENNERSSVSPGFLRDPKTFNHIDLRRQCQGVPNVKVLVLEKRPTCCCWSA